MKYDIKNIIFEFTFTILKENGIVLGMVETKEDKLFTKNILAYGFIIGITENIISDQIIFYN